MICFILKIFGYLKSSALAYLRLGNTLNPSERKAQNLYLYNEIKLYHNDSLNKMNYSGIVKKPALVDLSKTMTLSPWNSFKLYKGSTSGSSGMPLKFYKTKFSHSVCWHLILQRYAELGIDCFSKEARFYGSPDSFGKTLKVKLQDFLFNRYRFDTRDFSESKLETYIEVFKKKKFDYIFGYARAIIGFGLFLSERNIKLFNICPSIKVIILTGEMSSVEERETLEVTTGIKVVSEYGCSEFGYIGSEMERGCWRVNPMHLHVKSQDGVLLFTDLTNKAFPFVDYKLGDMGNVSYDDEGYQIISNLKGRINDMFKLPNGTMTHTMSFYYIMKECPSIANNVKEFQILYSRNSFCFKMVISKGAVNPMEIKKFISQYFHMAECDFEISIEIVEAIAKEKSGKFKFMIIK